IRSFASLLSALRVNSRLHNPFKLASNRLLHLGSPIDISIASAWNKHALDSTKVQPQPTPEQRPPAPRTNFSSNNEPDGFCNQ
ncbi:hypothetical protein FQN55_009021, partial [Onygenales sp. PD_40]